jgi:hypothetical protein
VRGSACRSRRIPRTGVLPEEVGAATAEDGFFELQTVPPGVHEVYVQTIGARPLRTDLATVAGQTLTIEAILAWRSP